MPDTNLFIENSTVSSKTSHTYPQSSHFFTISAPLQIPANKNPTSAEIDRRMLPQYLMSHTFITSKINCVALCHQQPLCGSVSFRKIPEKRDGECEINRVKYHVLTYDGDDGTFEASGWHWYNIIWNIIVKFLNCCLRVFHVKEAKAGGITK